nr:hypothetical protein [Streptococcus uberis]
MVDEIRPKKIESLDPEIEKFQEILTWVEIKGVLPKKTTSMQERKLFSRLKGIIENPEKIEKMKPYDRLNILEEIPNE